MRTLAALFLASLLAVMGYALFWWVSLEYTTGQLKTAVDEALRADIAFSTPQWVPDPSHVTMDLPSAELIFKDGPIREVRAPNLRLASSFLMRDRWTLQLPARVEVVLRNGSKLLVETEDGKVMWLREGNRLTLRAESVRVLNLAGGEVLRLGDMMLERKDSDAGVRLNLASRPRWQGGEGVLSGQMVMPSASFAEVLNLFGSGNMPGVGGLLRAVVAGMKPGAQLQLENISFKTMNEGEAPVSGAVFGTLSTLADGRLTGNLTLTTENGSQALAWVNRAGVLAPRMPIESLGVARFQRGVSAVRPTVRMENMQTTLTLNGHVVGPLPVARDVVNRLWPQQ
ncbi:MAG: hypothetical protein DI585_01575 [Pseudomonas fluorescens]|nr:MAG: hypothetical protein DI585_01575 [Pseudomonas fluorescens]